MSSVSFSDKRFRLCNPGDIDGAVAHQLATAQEKSLTRERVSNVSLLSTSVERELGLLPVLSEQRMRHFQRDVCRVEAAIATRHISKLRYLCVTIDQ